MKKYNKILSIAAIFILATLLLAACVRKSVISGKWYAVENDKYYKLEIEKNNKFQFSIEGNKISGKYKIKKNDINFSSSNKSFVGSVSGDNINVSYEGKKLKFSRYKQVNISFNTKGGSTLQAKKIDIATKVELNERSVKKGYTFKGWYLDQQYKKPFDPSKRIMSDLTVYAKWSKQSSAGEETEEGTMSNTVTYLADEFAATTARTHTVKDGEGYKLEVPTMSGGYEFLGWYTEDHKTQLTDDKGVSLNTWDSQSGDINAVAHYKSNLNLKYEKITEGQYKAYQDEAFTDSEVEIPKYYDGGIVSAVGRFSNAPTLEKIALGEAIEEVEENLAGNSEVFKNYEVSEKNKKYTSKEGVLYSKDLSTLYAYPIAKEGAEYVIDSSTTKIANRAFKDKFKGEQIDAETVGKHLIKVTMTQNVSEIGDEAFLNRVGLTNVDFTNVASPAEMRIGTRAFMYTKLEQYPIPANTVSIGEGAFESDLKMRNVVNIQQKELVFPEGLKEIGERAFLHNIALEKVKLAKTVESIGAYAFGSCANMQEFDSNKNELISKIPDGMLSKTIDLERFNFPKNITEIGTDALLATRIEELNIPETVTKIGDAAFAKMKSLKKINVPDSVVELGRGVFSETLSLKFDKIDVPSNSQVLLKENGGLYNRDKTELIKFDNSSTITEYTMPDTITSIDNGAFKENENLTKITLSKNLKRIGEQAFHSSKIEELTIPSTVEGIGPKAFYGTKQLKKLVFENASMLKTLPSGVFDTSSIEELTLPEGLEYATEKDIFRNMKNLKTLNIPSTLRDIEIGAMLTSTKIKTINVHDANEHLTVEDGILYTKDKKTLIYATTSFDKSTLDISGVTEIRKYAFYNNAKLKEVTGTSDLSAIREGAFQKSKIETIDLSNVLEIEKSAFKQSAIKKANLSNIETLGEQVFSRCTSLEELNLSNKISNIGRATFEQTKIKNLILPDSIENIGEMAFNKAEIETLVIGNGIKSMETVLDAFKTCAKLKSITLGDGITEVGEKAFSEWKSLEEIKLGNALSTIHTTAFDNLVNLKKVQAETQEQLNRLAEIPSINVDQSLKKATIVAKSTLDIASVEFLYNKKEDKGEYTELSEYAY